MDVNLGRIANEYPFKPKTLSIDGRWLGYLDEGPADAPALILLHGNPTWSFYYRKIVLAFRDRFRVIAPDHMGCGLSDKPQQYDYTLDTHIRNVERLAEHLGLDSVTLAMHDWGGAIGMGYAVRRPETIRSLVVFNTAAFRSGRIPLRIRICRYPLFGDVAVRGFNAFAGAAVRWGMATKKPERITPEVKAGYLLPYDSWANRIAILRFIRDIPLSPKDKSYETLAGIEERLSLFENTPMLILWGMRDFCFDEVFLAEWTRRFPAAAVHRFEEAGHYVVEDASERIIPIMRGFLDELP